MSDGAGYAVRVRPDALWTSGRRPVLTTLDIELTERCDNRCVHCCINRPERDEAAAARELSTERLLEVLDETAALGALSVRFTGGEALLRDDFEELYLHARRLGLRVILFTNARRITEPLARLFAEVPPLEPIEVTVYGMDPRTTAEVTRVATAHEEARRGLGLLAAHGVPFIVKGTLLPATIPEAEAFSAWADTLPGRRAEAGFVWFLDLRLRRDDEAADDRIRRLRLPPEAAAERLTHDAASLAALASDWRPRLREPSDRLFTCGAGHRPCLDAYGVLQPCLPLREPSVCVPLQPGRLRETVVEAFESLADRRATDPEYLRRCARCFLAGVCEQCPAKSWAEHGVLDRPVEYFCESTQAQARRLGWLREGERPWEVADWRERTGWTQR